MTEDPAEPPYRQAENLAMSERARSTPLPSLAACLLLTLAAGCTTLGIPEKQPSQPYAGDAVAKIADQLVKSAELRADLSTMRVIVYGNQEARPEKGLAYRNLSNPEELGFITRELEHEFMLALSGKLHLLDVELAGTNAPKLGQTSIQDAAEHYAATHVLVSEFVRHGDDLVVSARLIEAGTLLIVAAARGVVSVKQLSDYGRLALGEHVPFEPAVSAGGALEQASDPSRSISWAGWEPQPVPNATPVADAAQPADKPAASDARADSFAMAAPEAKKISPSSPTEVEAMPLPNGPGYYRMQALGRPLKPRKRKQQP